MLRRAALVEAERPCAGDLGVDADRLLDVSALLLGGEIAIVYPFEAVRGDFPSGLVHGRHALGIARHGSGEGEPRERQPALGEQPPQPPEAGARAELVDRLHVHVALAGPWLRANDLGQEGLRRAVAVEDAVLPALLVVDNELHGDARV